MNDLDLNKAVSKYSLASEHLTYKNGELHWAKGGRGRRVGVPAGCKDSTGYRVVSIKGNSILEHRLIWFMFNGSISEGLEIDHINGVRDDNRIENLRLATKQQNQCNMKRNSNNKTGYKGVCINHGRGKKYRVRIRDGKNKLSLGCFDNLEEAKAVYDKKARELHGEFYNYG